MDHNRPSTQYTREHLIQIAHKTGVLPNIVHVLKADAARVGERVPDKQIVEMAEACVVSFGDVTGFSTAEVMSPGGASRAPDGLLRLASGTRPSGWHVQGQGRRLRTDDLYKTDGQRAKEAKEKARVDAAIEGRKRDRAAVKASRELQVGTERQRQAHVLVRVQGLSLPEAGRRLGGITKQAVDRLLDKFDKAQQRGLTISPEPPRRAEGADIPERT